MIMGKIYTALGAKFWKLQADVELPKMFFTLRTFPKANISPQTHYD